MNIKEHNENIELREMLEGAEEIIESQREYIEDLQGDLVIALKELVIFKDRYIAELENALEDEELCMCDECRGVFH